MGEYNYTRSYVTAICATILTIAFLTSLTFFIMQLIGYIRIWDIRFTIGVSLVNLGLLLTILTSIGELKREIEEELVE